MQEIIGHCILSVRHYFRFESIRVCQWNPGAAQLKSSVLRSAHFRHSSHATSHFSLISLIFHDNTSTECNSFSPPWTFQFFFHLASIIISHYSYDLRFQLKDPCLHSSWRKGIKKKLLPWGCALPFSYTHLIGVYADFYVDFSSSNGLFVEELSKIAIWTFF